MALNSYDDFIDVPRVEAMGCDTLGNEIGHEAKGSHNTQIPIERFKNLKLYSMEFHCCQIGKIWLSLLRFKKKINN